MAWELIASGNKENVSSLPVYESQVNEGQRARLQFKFLTALPNFQIDNLRSSLEMAGVTDLQVVGKGDTIDIYYRKDPWWVPVIISMVLLLAVLLISWFFFKDVEGKLGPVGTTIAFAGIAVLVFGLVYSVVKRR